MAYPTGTVTFLFTDIEGSTKIARDHPESWEALRARHHAILRQAIEAHDGFVFEIIGDAFCAAFHSADQALRAAIRTQTDLGIENWGEVPIRVRIGIHTGKADLQEDGHYRGYLTLSRVQRLMSAGHGGQVLLSDTAESLAQGSLPREISLRDLGECRLKDMPRPEHIFQVVVPGLSSDFPPLRALQTSPNNLPAQLTSFVGREGDIAAVRRYLSDPETRLVTLIGPPGVGKTRLGLEVAAASLNDFLEGVFFTALATIEDPALMPTVIMQAIGLVVAGRQAAAEELMDGIGDRRMLLVLDNLEQITEGAAVLISSLLAACPGLKILTTSREALRVPGEWLFPVPTLSLPNSAQLKEPGSGVGLDNSALQLFAERARAVRPDFTLGADNLETVTAICTRLDGLPLGIELVAARVRLMPPQSLLARLDNQFTLSAAGMRGVAGRQKTLESAIRWSYDLLSEEEKRLFIHLSVFSGGFTLEDAGAIHAADGNAPMIPDQVAALMDKSLLRRGMDSGGEPRFDMLVTIQAFGRQRLQESGEETAVRGRHLDYFLDLAEEGDRHIHGPDQLEWLDRLDAGLDNFRLAMEWALATGQSGKLLRLFAALGWTWLVRWSTGEARKWLDSIRLLPDLSDHPEPYARVLNDLANLEWVAADFGKARALSEESHAISLSLGAEGRHGLAESLYLMGMVSFMVGDLAGAEPLYEQSYKIHQELEDRWGMAFTRFLLGDLKRLRNEDALAQDWLQQSLDLFNTLGDPWGMARSSQRLGDLFLKQGLFEEARTCFEQHLKLDESLHFNQGIAIALLLLGELHRNQGEFDLAEQYYERGHLITIECGLEGVRHTILYFRGMLALQQNNPSLARQLLKGYFDLFSRYAEKMGVIDFLSGMAAAAGCARQPERAAKLYGAAQAVLETTDYRIPPFDQAVIDRHIHSARDQIGDAAFDSYAAEGRLMTFDEAIIFASKTEL